ncbi:MAG TPA: aminotransferase class I/II-fold pyridoxal phosphate-dependent enzyme [bacterium]|nr:aminotransferase class I/II-fold pyridoxal phosphate-dependent enzyme [bacterium]HPJ72458.1 aminotransferase class I/II-fold pyridoxal phosphate-dependent enzyme [bacterium]HPQ66856.1 aminotransferase class I/II-fold pyridoxal phosphate-dependent enzyme [bacterium]
MSDLFAKCHEFTRAREVMEQGIYPYFTEIASAQETEVEIGGRKVLMLGSNCYLGLTCHPRVIEAAERALHKYGSGCAGSRFLNGTLDIHRHLEERLAAFLNQESALVYSTGFQANLGTISALVAKNEYVLIDRLDHASIIDGTRLAFGSIKKFRHNNMEDLERVLISCGDAGKLIVVDGVFSMEGDIAPLDSILDLAREYGARVLVDDAHAVGVLGPGGRGTAAYFGLEKEIDLITITFSKSFSSIGGAAAGSEEVIHYLKHHARPLIFSASLPPASVGAVMACLDIIEEEPERRARLWEITRKMKEGFQALGFDTGPSQTPIIPLFIGDLEKTFLMRKLLLDAGIFVNPVIPPAVPPDQTLIRTSFMATHTDAQLDFALETFGRIGKRLGVI